MAPCIACGSSLSAAMKGGVGSGLKSGISFGGRRRRRDLLNNGIIRRKRGFHGTSVEDSTPIGPHNSSPDRLSSNNAGAASLLKILQSSQVDGAAAVTPVAPLESRSENKLLDLLNRPKPEKVDSKLDTNPLTRGVNSSKAPSVIPEDSIHPQESSGSIHVSLQGSVKLETATPSLKKQSFEHIHPSRQASGNDSIFTYENPFDQLAASQNVYKAALTKEEPPYIARLPEVSQNSTQPDHAVKVEVEPASPVGKSTDNDDTNFTHPIDGIADVSEALAHNSWESAADSVENTRIVPVLEFPLNPFISITIKAQAKYIATFRDDGIMDIARLKKDFDQLDRSLTAATHEYIVYALAKPGGMRIIRQDDGSDRQVFRSTRDRIFNVALCTSRNHDSHAILGIGISGSVYWALVDGGQGKDLFESDALETESLVFPPFPASDENTSGGQLKTRAKRSSCHPDMIAISRGKNIYVISPQAAMSTEYGVTASERTVMTEKFFKEHALKISTGKAGKDFIFSADDTVIASLDKTGRLRFWDIQGFQENPSQANIFKGHDIKISLNTFVTGSPSEKSWPTSVLFLDRLRAYSRGFALRYVLVGLKQNHTLQLWDIGLGKVVEELKFPHDNESDAICSVSYHAPSGIIVVGHPTRNSIYFVHLSVPQYNLPAMSQAEYIVAAAEKKHNVPTPDATACLSGLREISFGSKGELRSVELLPLTKSTADKRSTKDAGLFELYVMHSHGVTCLNIKKEDLGWNSDNQVIRSIDAVSEGIAETDDIFSFPSDSEPSKGDPFIKGDVSVPRVGSSSHQQLCAKILKKHVAEEVVEKPTHVDTIAAYLKIPLGSKISRDQAVEAMEHSLKHTVLKGEEKERLRLAFEDLIAVTTAYSQGYGVEVEGNDVRLHVENTLAKGIYETMVHYLIQVEENGWPQPIDTFGSVAKDICGKIHPQDKIRCGDQSFRDPLPDFYYRGIVAASRSMIDYADLLQKQERVVPRYSSRQYFRFPARDFAHRFTMDNKKELERGLVAVSLIEFELRSNATVDSTSDVAHEAPPIVTAEPPLECANDVTSDASSDTANGAATFGIPNSTYVATETYLEDPNGANRNISAEPPLQHATDSARETLPADLMDIITGQTSQQVVHDVGSLLEKRFDNLHERWAEERRVQDDASIHKQKEIIHLVSSTLSDSVIGNIRGILSDVVAEQVVPALGDRLFATFPDELHNVFKDPTVVSSIVGLTVEQLSSRLSPYINEAFKASITPILDKAAQDFKVANQNTESKLVEHLQLYEKQRRADQAKLEEILLTVRGLSTTMAAQSQQSSQQVTQTRTNSSVSVSMGQQAGTPSRTPQYDSLACAPAQATPALTQDETAHLHAASSPALSAEDSEMNTMYHLVKSGRREEALLMYVSVIPFNILFPVTNTSQDANMREMSDKLLGDLESRIKNLYMALISANPQDPVVRLLAPIRRRLQFLSRV
ncbi:hypothetical protein N7495_004552 [Penicillium taxi]|uniref:uncharacterized protein n=1 Tax=Penicillium taxi TaxID=168475 RepID=UPI002544F0CC|nr:uncharacterized protein N7495_004552 [Penicillium taxi]KAJ5899808.1 hypothetical protein N7495_004552 [Penicillium taxi]